MMTPMMLTNEEDAPAYINQAFQSQIGYVITDLPDKNTWLEKAYPDPGYREKIMKDWEDASIEAQKNRDAPIHVISNICCGDGVHRWFDVHQHTIGARRVTTFLNIDVLMRHAGDLASVAQLKEKLAGIITRNTTGPADRISEISQAFHS